MNINEMIFSRIAAKKKLEMVENLSESELLSVTSDTIKRMVKEVGSNYHKSRDKRLTLSPELRTGNNWNSDIEGVSVIKDRLYVDFYVQYSNTDTSTSETFENFFRRGDYRGCVIGSDHYGNDRHYYFTYSESEKACCIRRLLLQYLHLKYKERLGEI